MLYYLCVVVRCLKHLVAYVVSFFKSEWWYKLSHLFVVLSY